MDKATLDAAYNNSAAVTDSAEILMRWEDRSMQLRSSRASLLDLRYATGERNRIDCFDAGPGTPWLAFIHGGYWQMRAKESFHFLAAGPLAHGISVAFIGYTLAPQKRLDGIVAEISVALDVLAQRVGAIHLSGWSAGAHLTAMSMGHPAVTSGLAISGIYDLEPMRLCYVNDKLGLDEDEVVRNSPIALHASGKPLLIAYGGSELAELQRQSASYFQTLQSQRPDVHALERLDGHHHFSILEELASPTGALALAAARLTAVR
jgi:acetyl esterase/lipase